MVAAFGTGAINAPAGKVSVNSALVSGILLGFVIVTVKVLASLTRRVGLANALAMLAGERICTVDIAGSLLVIGPPPGELIAVTAPAGIVLVYELLEADCTKSVISQVAGTLPLAADSVAPVSVTDVGVEETEPPAQVVLRADGEDGARPAGSGSVNDKLVAATESELMIRMRNCTGVLGGAEAGVNDFSTPSEAKVAKLVLNMLGLVTF